MMMETLSKIRAISVVALALIGTTFLAVHTSKQEIASSEDDINAFGSNQIIDQLSEPDIGAASPIDAQSWTTLPNINNARFESTTIQYRDDIYVFNGFGAGVKVQPAVEKFDAGTQKWSVISSASLAQGNAVTHNGTVLVGNEVWIIGGRVGNHPGAVTAKVWKFNLTTYQWSQGPQLPVPVAAGGAALVDNRIHWFGGLDPKAQCDVSHHYVYDMDNPSNGWSNISGIAPMPIPRNHFATAVHDGLIYAIGGQFTHDGCGAGTPDTDLVHVFNPQINTWEQVASLPAIQSHIEPSTFVYKDAIYVVGGATGGNKVYRYDPSTNTWDTVAVLPQPLLAPIARVIDGQLIVSSGGAPTIIPTLATYTTDMTPLLLPDTAEPNTNSSSVAIASTSETPAQLSSDAGVVVLEAEYYDTATGTNTHKWVEANLPGASENGAMVTTPNQNKLATTTQGSPSINYYAYFDRPGKWYLWIRGWGDTVNGEGKNDSLHAGLNGTLSPTADRIDNFPSGWHWSNSTRDGVRASLEIPTAGINAINLWMREDGLAVDKILLTTNPQFIPTGEGLNHENGHTVANSGSDDETIVIIDTYTEEVQANVATDHETVSSEDTTSSPTVATGTAPDNNIELPDSQESWQHVTTADGSNIQPRHEAGGVAYEGKLYVLGGRGTRNVSVYDPASNTWTTKSPPPIVLHHFQPVVFNNKIWVIGAFTGNYPNETSVPDIYTYNPATDAWAKEGNVPANRRRGSAGAVVHENLIYLVGGNNNGHRSGAKPWFDSFNPATGQWEVLADSSIARDHITVSVSDNKLVVAAGRKSAYPETFMHTVSVTDVFDFESDSWSRGADIPTTRAGTMAVSIGSEVIVIGGERADSAKARAEVEAYNVNKNTWRTLKPLNVGRHSGAAAVIGDKIHVVTGSERLGGNPESKSHETLRLPTQNSGLFDSDKDLISLHYDFAPDRDDAHASVSALQLTSVLGIQPLVVTGSTGDGNRHRYIDGSELLQDTIWGTNRHIDARNNWQSAVQEVASRWAAVLQSDAKVLVAEGGQADFTADVLKELKLRGTNFLRAQVVVVQHSEWNERQSNQNDLSYVKANATYIKIADGNIVNETADLFSKSDAFVAAAKTGAFVQEWNAAFEYLDPNVKLDFSDTVELLHILGIGIDRVATPDDFMDFINSVSPIPQADNATEETPGPVTAGPRAGVVYRVNAGGNSLVNQWSADSDSRQYEADGGNWSISQTINRGVVPADIPLNIFKTERWHSATQHWKFPVSPGQYLVTLYFSENWPGAFKKNGRVFDVEVEGKLLKALDVYSEAGAYSALHKTFIVTADATLDVRLKKIIQNPSVKGIEIISISEPPAPEDAASVSEIEVPASEDEASVSEEETPTSEGEASISEEEAPASENEVLVSGDEVAMSVPSNPSTEVVDSTRTTPAPTSETPEDTTAEVSVDPFPRSVIYRVNAGSNSQINQWTTDRIARQYNASGGNWNTTQSIDQGNVPTDIPTNIFKSERWRNTSQHWKFPVSPGEYEVRLYFAENWSGAFKKGGRVFDVEVEGKSLKALDVYSEAGAHTALQKMFIVTADATLDIKLNKVIQNPSVKGIEIIALGQTAVSEVESIANPQASPTEEPQSPFTPTAVETAAGKCEVHASSLRNAIDLYNSTCTMPRKDCDPAPGGWICSSENL